MRPERRKKNRIQLTRALIARFGTMGVVVLDLTDCGARIEHFHRLDVAKTATFHLEWQGNRVETTARVVSCRVHRFAAGDSGTTVYQSGLFFADHAGDSAAALREIVSTVVARSLAEQVANARGLGPVIERDMPVFRDGVVAANGLDRGYLHCTVVGGVRFEKKWSRTSEAPAEGFTVSASEPVEHVDQLCENYLRGDEEQRKLIVLLARLSLEKTV